MLVENHDISSVIYIVPYSINQPYLSFVESKCKWAGLISWCNMKVWISYHSVSFVSNVNHFISVTKHIYTTNLTHELTYIYSCFGFVCLNKFICKTCIIFNLYFDIFILCLSMDQVIYPTHDVVFTWMKIK